MRLCDDGHEEVCYEGKDCPVCDAIAELREAEEQIRDLTERIETLEAVLADAGTR